MPLFNTLDTLQPTQHYVAPDFIKGDDLSGFGRTMMTLSGHKNSGQKNTWGKILGWLNPGLAIAGDATARLYADKTDSDDSVKNIEQGFKRDIGKAITVGAAVGGLTGVIPPQQAVQLGMQGIGQITANPPQDEAGVDDKKSYYTYKKGGEMKEDIDMIDKDTGRKVGEISYHEGILSKADYSRFKMLYDKKDEKAMGKQMYKIMSRHKQINEEDTDNSEEGEIKELEEQYNKGGELTEQKAKTILKDGKIRGVSLSDKQKRYFGWVAGGRKEDVKKYILGSEVLPNNFYSITNKGIGSNLWEGVPYANAPSYSGGDVGSGSGLDFSKLFNKLGGAGQLLPMAQAVIGLADSRGELPQYEKPQAWNDFMQRMYQRSYSGLSPAEQALAHRGNMDALAVGLANARNFSGGNSAFALGAQQGLVPQYSKAEANIAAMNENLRRRNMMDYGRFLGNDVSMDRQIFLDRYNQALMEKRAASQLAHTGLQGMIDRYEYERNRPLQEEYTMAMIDRMKNNSSQGNNMFSDYFDRIFNPPQTYTPSYYPFKNLYLDKTVKFKGLNLQN